ncbi:MAG: electron transport complex subunit RsxC [Bacteroidales bacterium]|nr:electron transport complex subunit RsxC [Bacteroidales bacterium]
MLHTFHKGGVHPPEYKITAHKPIVDLELPTQVVVTFSQHIGAIAKCELKKGDHVNRGDIIAKAAGFVSANVHTPITGTITKIDRHKTAFGNPADTVTIEATEEEHLADLEAIKNRKPIRTDEESLALDPKEIISIIDDAGIVGLGGATFPTKVKLSPPPGSKAELLIINGVECEPFLTNDHAIMLEQPEAIVLGIRLLMRAANVDKCVVGIENNKPDAIETMRKTTAAYPEIEIMPLKVKYPEGSEKQLIEAIMGREVPSGGLPIAVGAIVQNCATALAVADAVRYGEPLMSRVLTVTGPSVKNPGNFRVAIGTPLTTVVEAAGGVPQDTGKIILGGPMMGKSVVTIDAPTIKGVSGLLMLPESMSERRKVEPCIRCAACVDACPMGLEPYLLATLSRLGEFDKVEANKVMNCMECGSCSYICPSARPILDYIRLGKNKVKSLKLKVLKFKVNSIFIRN